MAPPVGMLIPFYLMYRAAGMIDTYPALILAHAGMNLPLITWMMTGFFRDIPREVEEAAYLDGCSPIGAFLRITIPMAMNGIITVGIIGFIFSWNELMFATTVTGTSTRTAPAAISNFLLYQEVKWGPLTAAAVTVALPALAFIGFAQRHLLRGLTFGTR
jgi:multiple sugar transport system permease protein